MVVQVGGAFSYEQGTPVAGCDFLQLHRRSRHACPLLDAGVWSAAFFAAECTRAAALYQRAGNPVHAVTGNPVQWYLAHKKTPTPLGPP